MTVEQILFCDACKERIDRRFNKCIDICEDCEKIVENIGKGRSNIEEKVVVSRFFVVSVISSLAQSFFLLAFILGDDVSSEWLVDSALGIGIYFILLLTLIFPLVLGVMENYKFKKGD